MTVFVRFFVHPSPQFEFWGVGADSKETIFNPGMDGDKTESRKEMVKLVICDDSCPYRKNTALFLDTATYSGYCSIFLFGS